MCESVVTDVEEKAYIWILLFYKAHIEKPLIKPNSTRIGNKITPRVNHDQSQSQVT